MGSAWVNRKMRGLSVLLLGLLAALTKGQGSAMKEIMEGIDMYNFRARCWGEANVDKQIAALETAKKICSQVASPLERFGSFARVRPFFASRRQDHADNVLSVLQSGGDLSNVGSLWRNKRDTFDLDSINRFSDGNGILNPDEDDILEFLDQFADFKSNVACRMGKLTCSTGWKSSTAPWTLTSWLRGWTSWVCPRTSTTRPRSRWRCCTTRPLRRRSSSTASCGP